MKLPRALTVVAVVVVVGTLVATGPAVGLIELPTANDGTELGDGTATVGNVEYADGPPRIEPGRFGSGVQYLRTPSLRVDVTDVRGTPRLVYVLTVPALGFERVETRLLTTDESTTVVLSMADRSFDEAVTDERTYEGKVVVRVQSFSGDRVIVSRNVTVEVSNNG